MTLFGILWLGLIGACFYREKIQSLIVLTLLSMVFQCSNVISVGKLNVGPQVITNLAFLFMLLLRALKQETIWFRRWGRAAYSASALLAAVVLSSFLNGNLGGVLLRVMQLAVYEASFLMMARMRPYVTDAFLERVIRRITIFVLVMGVVQLLITSGVLPRFGVVKVLFYNENASYVYFNQPHYTRLMSTFLEPSYCGCFLVGAFFYFASAWKGTKRELWLLAALAAELLLTRSSSAYGAFAVTGVVFLLRGRKPNMQKLLLLAGGFCLVCMLLYGRGVLDEVVFSKLASGSGVTRRHWNRAAWQAFCRSPLYGTGYKSARASSLLFSVLGELGLLGLASWLALNIGLLRPLWRKRRRYTRHFLGVRFALLAILLAQLFACPDLDLCVYWMWMDLAGLYGLSGPGLGLRLLPARNTRGKLTHPNPEGRACADRRLSRV